MLDTRSLVLFAFVTGSTVFILFVWILLYMWCLRKLYKRDHNKNWQLQAARARTAYLYFKKFLCFLCACRRDVVLLYFFINFYFIKIFTKYIATEYTFSSNGWVPIVTDQIYNPNTKEWKENDVNLPLKSHIVTSNVIKISKAPTNQEKESNTYKDVDIVENSIFSHDSDAKINDQRAYKYTKHADNTTKLTRTAKQINELLTDKNIEVTNVENIKKNKDVFEKDNKISATWQRSNTYEVEETIDSLEAEDNNSKEVIGYDYTPPVKKNQSFSSTLMNIWSKYNIKTDDTLKNYELSRQAKSQSGVPNFSRILHPYRYNSLNHLPVDPLLAVFLSNYGFYFPNLYGIKSNYNNLYGYLASNNIHNNRPFGLYKIFSDTDSWN